MTEQAARSPGETDEDVPSTARLYDYLLGGAHNFAADRRLGEKFLTALPSARDVARCNRAFLRRAVVTLAESGIRQFLDIGSGIPTVGTVHEIAHGLDPQAGVVYVDNESVAVAHSELLLDGDHRAAAIRADLREPDRILQHPETRRLLDFSQPIGLLMVGVLHFIPHRSDVAGIVRQYHDALSPGSFLALSHCTADIEPDDMAGVVEVMRDSTAPVHPRTHAEVTELFGGFELIDPGVVGTALWRPDEAGSPAERPGAARVYAGVGHKP